MATSDLRTLLTTSQLCWDKATRQFTVWASGIGWPAGSFPRRVDVQSHVTGAIRTFALVAAESNDEGDLVSLRYEAYDIALVVVND